MPESVTINSRKFDLSISRSWTCRLLKQQDTLLEFIGEFDSEVRHPDLGLIKRGTVSHEFYWLDRYYNVFRFHEPDGSLRNFYCNINLPPTFSDNVLDYIDLDIDVLVWPAFDYEILDLDDFEENARVFNYPEEVRNKAMQTLDELIAAINTREFPFDHRG